MSDLRMGKSISLNGINIIPIEKVSVRNYVLRRGYWVYASKEPVSIVVCDAHGVRAFDIQAPGLSLKELIVKVPGLEALLAKFTAVRD
ncbi:MAG: hypothetical protein ACLP5H_28530 [Desulfomonilaceae bacterium]